MNKSSRFFILTTLLILVILLIINPLPYVNGAIEGLKLFIFKVFPVMLPFFIITRMLTSLGLGYYLSKIFLKPTKFLYNSSPIGGYIFALSSLSGYPLGAKLIADCVENGSLENDEAKSIIAYTSTSGPVFILGTIGVVLLNDYKAGCIILIAHILGAVLNGLLYRGNSYNENQIVLLKFDINSIFSDALTASIYSILQVGVSIIFLNVISVAINQLSLIEIIFAICNKYQINGNVLEGIVYGLVEITNGVNIISQSNLKIKDIIVIITTIISFGGLSVYMQSMTFLGKAKISGKYFLLTKITHALIAYVVSSILVAIFY